MLSVLFVVALLGYAIIYTGIAALSGGRAPGILESLHPSFSGVALRGAGPGLGSTIGSTVGNVGTTVGGAVGATPAVRTILGALGSIPGWNLIRVCGPGSVSGSQHPACNAADIGGPRAVLFVVQAALLAAGKARALPIHCVIGPSNVAGWEKGAIRSRTSGWVAREYTGPNSHQTHVHVSGWPSVGGGC